MDSTQTWKGIDDFKGVVNGWADKMGVAPRRIQVQAMRRKWASCSSEGTISFSSELLAKDREFGEAVIVHELLHLRIPNHGRLFKSLFRAYLPDIDPETLGLGHCGATRTGVAIDVT